MLQFPNRRLNSAPYDAGKVPPSRIGRILYPGWRVKPDYLFRGRRTFGSLSADKQTIAMVEHGSSNPK